MCNQLVYHRNRTTFARGKIKSVYKRAIKRKERIFKFCVYIYIYLSNKNIRLSSKFYLLDNSKLSFQILFEIKFCKRFVYFNYAIVK